MKKGKSFRPASTTEVCEAASTYIFKEATSTKRTIRSAADAKEYLSRQAGVDHEQFGAIFLDNRFRVLSIEILFVGTISVAVVHPREVAKRALQLDASAIMIFHNHPSGCCEPSAADIQLTRGLAEALAMLDITLVDHILIAGIKAISFVERGIMGGKND
jgi:DNA repair protein RadC